MPRRVKKNRSFLAPFADNFRSRLTGADARIRRRIVKTALLVISLWFFYSLVVGTYSIPRIIRLELEGHSLRETNRQMTIDLIAADRTRQLLQSNPSYIEFVARTRYRMVRSDETIYRLRGQ